MAADQLVEELERLDYTGSMEEVLARLTSSHMEQFEAAESAEELHPFLYFAARRLVVEMGNGYTVALSLKNAAKYLGGARAIIATEALRRKGYLSIEWIETRPFRHFQRAPFVLTVTPGRRPRRAEATL